jgi:hypothetical protein
MLLLLLLLWLWLWLQWLIHVWLRAMHSHVLRMRARRASIVDHSAA